MPVGAAVTRGRRDDGRDLQPQPSSPRRPLALLLHVGVERRGDIGDAGCVRARDLGAVPKSWGEQAMSPAPQRSWTAAARERALAALPPEKLLPDSQPSYMSSWIYIFGVLSLVSLVLIIASGSILTLKGPQWWHFTGIGHFFNSIHLWSVELFFFFTVIHL